MTLSEFIKKRLEEMGRNKSWLVNFNDLEWSTFTRINKGLPITKATQEKLAKALECSQGDIQACMAETPNPLRKEAAKPEGTAGISIMAKPKKKPKPEAPAPDPKDEEPADVFQPDEDDEDEEQAEYTLSEVKTFEKMALNDYQQHLRDLAWRIFLSGVPGTHTVKDMYADIGYALVQELGIKNKGGETE